MSLSSDEEYFDCSNEPVKYYAVACQKDIDSGLVTTDIKEALKKVKSVKGSRFNTFYNALDAQRFSESVLLETSKSEKETDKLPKDEPGPYADISRLELIKLKTAIEKGFVEIFRELISINPRYLVTTNDLPTILQTNFKFNALHIASKWNRASIVRLILDNLSSEQFWHSLHPSANDRSNKDRMYRVIDMYLNTPDSLQYRPGAVLPPQNNDTPLHLAAKEGHGECVRALLSHELTDTTMRNGKGMRAEEIICSRYTGEQLEAKVGEIGAIFSEKYVVLLIDGDRMDILEPVSHWRLLRLLRAFNDEYKTADVIPARSHSPILGSVTNYSGFVRAYIGPLPDAAARELQRRWSVLTIDDASMFYESRHNDAEKGLECHGRYLANHYGAPWKEFWSFLNCYTDLGDEEGLNKLEEHLITCQNMTDTSLIDSDDDSNDDDDNHVSDVSNTSSMFVITPSSGDKTLQRAYDTLARLFGLLTLNTSRDNIVIEPPINPSTTGHASLNRSTNHRHASPSTNINRHASPSTNINHRHASPSTNINHRHASFHTPTRTKSSTINSVRGLRPRLDTSVLGQGVLTPTDKHVRRALLATPEGRHRQYPRISSWLNDLSLVDPDFDTDMCTTPSIADAISSTPLRTRPKNPYRVPPSPLANTRRPPSSIFLL